METCVFIPDATLKAVKRHLFPARNRLEQAGFLLCQIQINGNEQATFSARHWVPLKAEDYVVQSKSYLEITDEARARIIKLAHDERSALVEVHCHPFPSPACFSGSDVEGLLEFVPHVRWRLKGQPYGALVFGPETVDGLAWIAKSKSAIPVGAITGDLTAWPTTGLTLKRFGTIQHG